MFSLLSRGYGTYDGKAKKDTQETREHKVNLSVTDHLQSVLFHHAGCRIVLIRGLKCVLCFYFIVDNTSVTF